MALLSGSVEFTVGNIISGALPVVKLRVKLLASAMPSVFLDPVVIVPV